MIEGLSGTSINLTMCQLTNLEYKNTSTKNYFHILKIAPIHDTIEHMYYY